MSDLFQNSVEAGASLVELGLIQDENFLVIQIVDNGSGMTSEELVRAQDPFYSDGKKHPGRKVGLGLPFVVQTTQSTGGSFEIFSTKGQGTRLKVGFNLKHWDTPPLGDLALALTQIVGLPGQFEAKITRSLMGREWSVNRSELQEVLGTFDDPGAWGLLKQFFESSEEELKTGE